MDLKIDTINKSNRKEEWDNIEMLVITYQKQFLDPLYKEESQEAANMLLKKFEPLFLKYIQLIKTGQINYSDSEMKGFVFLFIDDKELKKSLKRYKQTSEYRTKIYQQFLFVCKTYGRLSQQEILMDLQICLLTLAKKYKQMNRSFCGYVYNAFKFSVYRIVKSFVKNPLNIKYKHVLIDEEWFIDRYNFDSNAEEYYELFTGLPGSLWISGEVCSEPFADLSILERKILSKYYLEYWNDRQIAQMFSLKHNVVNKTRKEAVLKVAKKLNIPKEKIKRVRRSGNLSVLPLQKER